MKIAQNIALYSFLLNNHHGKNFHWSFKKFVKSHFHELVIVSLSFHEFFDPFLKDHFEKNREMK